MARIEAAMAEIVAQDLPFQRRVISRAEALALFRARNERYKVELIEAIPPGEEISLYEHGDFVDLCRGPHVERTGQIGAFKVLSFAGAYWRGDERNPQLQRIYGTAFATPSDLEAHLARVEEASTAPRSTSRSRMLSVASGSARPSSSTSSCRSGSPWSTSPPTEAADSRS